MEEGSGLYSIEELKSGMQKLIGFGPRLTGNKSHRDMIDWLEGELTSLGYEVKSDTHTFKRWEPFNWSLTYSDKGNTIEVEQPSYYPYSGCTKEEGVTAEMFLCGKAIASIFGSKNKIAVVTMPIFQASCGLIFKKRDCFPEDFVPPEKQGSPVVASFVIPPLIEIARIAGAKGVICIMTGVSDDLARHQYLPFIKKYAGIPALWVDETQGKKIIAAAKRREKATLKLFAEVTEHAPTRTLYAVLIGKSDKDSILVNTHTDGPNAFEENGALGILSLARYFAAKPIEAREKNIVFSLVTGHFQLNQFGDPMNQATTKYLNAHRELWDGKGDNLSAVAGLTLEHLGCSEWRDSADHKQFVRVSEVDPELVYTSNKTMADIYMEAIQNRRFTKTLLLQPKNMVHFGEGQPIYKKGIPSISLCPGPDYLCNNAPGGYIEKLNYEMMYEQIDSFRKAIEIIDKKSRKELGRKDGFAWGFIF